MISCNSFFLKNLTSIHNCLKLIKFNLHLKKQRRQSPVGIHNCSILDLYNRQLVCSDNSDIFVLLHLKLVLFVSVSPTCPRYAFHILHGHASRTYILILNLKSLRDSDSFISVGAKPYIFGTR